MIRDVLRTIGTGCILAGGILYFTTDSGENVATEDTKQLQEEVVQLRSELAKTKEELAIAQTASSVKVNKSENESTAQQVLVIERGANSTMVSAALENMGIIANAAEFEQYLSTNGLSRKLQVGEHEVDASMDYALIADIITTVK